MAGESHTTTDHKTIQRWVEARGGHPATVKNTARGDEAGVLRIDFPGYRGEDTLEEISWEDFFAKFDEKQLAFLYQEHTSSGEESRFFKLVSRDTAEHKTSGSSSHKAEAHESEHKTASKGHNLKDEEERGQHKTPGKSHSHEETHVTEHKSSRSHK